MQTRVGILNIKVLPLVAAIAAGFWTGIGYCREIALMIDYYDSSKSLTSGSAKMTERRFKASFKERPSITAIIVHARNSDELKSELSKLSLKSGDQITHLYIDGHGSSSFATEVVSHNEKVITERSLLRSFLAAADDIGFSFPLNIKDETNFDELQQEILNVNAKTVDVFSSIRGQFSDDVEIYCSACNFLSENSVFAGATGSTVQAVLAINNGQFYGNYTDGQIDVRVFLEPFWQLAGWRNKLLIGGIQALNLGVVIGAVVMKQPIFLLGNISSVAALLVIPLFRDKGYQINFINGGVKSIKKIRARSFLKTFFNKQGCTELSTLSDEQQTN